MSEILGTMFKYFLALLGVGAVIAVMVQAMSNNKASQYAAEVGQLAAGIEQLYANSTGFSNLDAGALVSANIVPPAMVSTSTTGSTTTTTLNSPWGTSVSLSGSGTSFSIATTGVPSADCIKLVSSVSAYATVTIGGGTTALASTATPTTITTSCTANPSVAVSFGFTG